MSAAFTRKTALAVVALALIGVLAYALLPTARTPMPATIFTTVGGELISSRQLRGRVVLIDFWATDCEPCLREMPQRAALYDEYRPLGLELLAVAMSQDRPDRVLAYTERARLPFKVALDVQGTVARDFGGIEAIPVSFLIDKRGMIIKRFIGIADAAELRALIEAALGEPA